MTRDERLASIAALLKARAYDEARQKLKQYLQAQPDDPEAWYLLSFVEPSASRRVTAVRRALELNPSFDRAKARLARLQPTTRPLQRSSIGLAILAILAFGALIVLAIAFLLPAMNPRQLPAVLSLPSEPPRVAATPTQTRPIPATATAIPSATASETATSTVAATPSSTSTIVTLTASPVPPTEVYQQPPTQGIEPTQTVQLQATTPVATTPVVSPTSNAPSAQPEPTASPLAPTIPTTPLPTRPPRPTRAPTSTPQPTQPPVGTVTVVPPTLVPTPSNSIPLQRLVDVGTGKMMVVSATCPATDALRDILGSAPSAPPSGSDWLLVEALIRCSGASNCAPDKSSLMVVGSSGRAYPVDSTLSLQPSFGADGYNNNQVWGYLAFIVSTGEQRLSLVLSQSGRSYSFVLR
jgi:hypothetical protein